MTKLALTIIILTNRADERFAATLANAQFADEVLVIDNKSGNDWSALKEKHSFHVIDHHEPITNFSQVRNNSLKHVSHHWVLFLDSDETVAEHSIPVISEIIQKNTSDGIIARRSDVFYGEKLEYGEAGNQPIIRMGKRNTIHFTGAVHEVAQINGHLAHAEVEILHYSHPSISEFIAKVSQYSHQVAQEKQSTWLQLLFELLLYPPAKFLYGYCIQGGYQDGWRGLVYAACMSLHSLIVRIYTYEKTFLTRPATD